MGANGSTTSASRHGYYYSEDKPCMPDGIPKVTEITHNSVTLSWQPALNSGKFLAYQVECLNSKDRKWKVATRSCQGTTYRIRNLHPESSYIFRIRAENIFGQSKPGQATKEVWTRPIPTNCLEAKPLAKCTRRNSHYLKFDGGLNMLLNKTEVDEQDGSSDIGSIPFKRNSSLRGSLPAYFHTRKASLNTGMLPGSRRESVCSFKESKKSLVETILPEEGPNVKRFSTSTEASSLFSSSSITSILEEDELRPLYRQTDCNVCSDNDDAYSTTNSHITTSSGFSSVSSRSSNSSGYHSSHNAFVNRHRNPFLAAFTDDAKIEYCSQSESTLDMKYDSKHIKNDSKSANPNAGKTIFDICDSEIWKGHIENHSTVNTESSRENNVNNEVAHNMDLRTLRNMLNSQDVMVKTFNTCALENQRTHFIIKEIDEETALDIISAL